ncbi:aminoglycoside 3-N-acetyltransferase [Limimaricola pyoseonensis]|uniref:Aminoglycoside N(3)-acetyltransferase n=1 Tax=Limimaricola pyoseonensis TaxID=521013 RepID=A0A1G6ZCQ8_9RHOB|nr:aminoglycoside 3-N-acetyltransferase [Limimaricola pyoseonensis]SDE00439.1 aminoglycoside 3-N-acetyltransferase [Limimaricola pyoseonensis]
MAANPHSRTDLARDLRALGLRAGDTVMVHAALRRLGRVLGGAVVLVDALLDATGPGGTVMAYTDFGTEYDDLLDGEGRVPAQWRPHLPPFDPAATPAIREVGAWPELLRTRPGARRSANPGAACAALGARAPDLTRDHPHDYGYGADSPFGRLAALPGGRVLMLGAPWETMTLLHHAEQMARLPDRRVRRYEVPLAVEDGVSWRMIEEFETRIPVLPEFRDDYFGDIVRDFVASGQGREGRVGDAPALLVGAGAIVDFACRWMEERAGA